MKTKDISKVKTWKVLFFMVIMLLNVIEIYSPNFEHDNVHKFNASDKLL